MHIVCVMSARFDGFLHITETLEKMGHIVRFFPTEPYREICSYAEKKLDKLGFHQGRERYLHQWRENLYRTMEKFHPDVILFINIPKAILGEVDQKKIKQAFTPPRKFCAGSWIALLVREDGRRFSHIVIASMSLRNGMCCFCRSGIRSPLHIVPWDITRHMRGGRHAGIRRLILPLWGRRIEIVCISWNRLLPMPCAMDGAWQFMARFMKSDIFGRSTSFRENIHTSQNILPMAWCCRRRLRSSMHARKSA